MIGPRAIAALGLFALCAVQPGHAPRVPLSQQALAAISANRIALIPVERQRLNWTGPHNEGSCVHASMYMLFGWQGRPDLAEWWRATYSDGEYPAGLTAKLDAAGIPYAKTEASDVSFLEWACATRRGAAVRVQKGAHMVCLVGLDDKTATIFDSNSPGKLRTLDRAAFLNDWTSSHGSGWAVTPLVGPPAPPFPWTGVSAQ